MRLDRGDGLLLTVIVVALGLVALRPRPREIRDPLSLAEIVPHWRTFGSRASADSGSTGSKHSVVVFSDYACGACRALDSMLAGHVASREVSVSVRHLPIIGGPASETAARLVLCEAAVAGTRELHGGFFAERESIEERVESARRRLGETGAVGKSILECAESQLADSLIRRDRHDAARLGLIATPGILVDSLLFRGLPSGLLDLLARPE